MHDMTTSEIDFGAILADTAPRGRVSAWSRGAHAYAAELLENLSEAMESGYVAASELVNDRLVTRALLNGADDWQQYSESGCSLISDVDICRRLCTPSELARLARNGYRHPGEGRNDRRIGFPVESSWIDTQARALYQAAAIVTPAIAAAAVDSDA